MKLEKINDNQIRCTLNKTDLSKRQLKLSELAYGSEKARALFHDMMEQAAIELGFEAENIPLMIEAIPISSDCLVLLITKVENPDELDTRFSRFSKSTSDDASEEDMDFFEDEDDFEDMVRELSAFDDDEPLAFPPAAEEPTAERSSVDEALDLLAPFTKALAQAKKATEEEIAKKKAPTDMHQYYSFSSLDSVARLGAFLRPFFRGESTLYKDPAAGTYFLLLAQGKEEVERFARACLIAADFGVKIAAAYATDSYFEEHFECLLAESALETVAELA